MVWVKPVLLRIALVSDEAEQLVLENGSPKGATVEVLVEGRPLAWQRKVVAIIQEGVAIELEGGAVEAVGAAFDGLVDDRSAVSRIFRIQGAGDDGLFGDGVRIDRNATGLQRAVIDINAVEDKRVAGGLRAVGRIGAEAVRGLDAARLQLLQTCRIPTEERNLFDFGWR